MNQPHAQAEPETERVVLLHGLSRTRRSMQNLEQACRDAGYETLNWDYPSREHKVAELVALFRDLCAELAERPKRTHFVGHSLGGLICRAGLAQPVALPLGRLVMIASPNRGVRIVRRFQNLPVLADIPRLFGRPALELGRDASWLRELGTPPMEIGVIAGTRGFHPLNPSSWMNTLLGNEGIHDGTVELDSAMFPGMQDFLSVDVAHTFICDDPKVIAAVLAFLQAGRFRAS